MVSFTFRRVRTSLYILFEIGISMSDLRVLFLLHDLVSSISAFVCLFARYSQFVEHIIREHLLRTLFEGTERLIRFLEIPLSDSTL